MSEIYENINDLNFSAVLFEQMLRINSISTKFYDNRVAKVLDYAWAVRDFVNLVPSSIRIKSKDFNDKLFDIDAELKIYYDSVNTKDRSLYDFQKKAQDMMFLCINLFADNGLLYKRHGRGDYD
jgi:hypothetical protein